VCRSVRNIMPVLLTQTIVLFKDTYTGLWRRSGFPRCGQQVAQRTGGTWWKDGFVRALVALFIIPVSRRSASAACRRVSDSFDSQGAAGGRMIEINHVDKWRYNAGFQALKTAPHIRRQGRGGGGVRTVG